MTKKRILFLITGLEKGGAEMTLLHTLPLLQDQFDVRVSALTGHGPMGGLLQDAGIPVDYLNFRSPFDLAALRRFRCIIRSYQPDLLVTMLIHADLFGRVFGRIFGVKRIVCSKRGALKRWIYFDKLTSGLVTHYLVQTVAAKQDVMRKIGVDAAKITVIPNGLDVNDYPAAVDSSWVIKLGLNPNRLNLVCVANLKQGKGHHLLLSAFAEVSEHVPNSLNLLLVGDGPERAALQTQAKTLACHDQIYFLGLRTDVPEILAISDIFVLATESEGMSNAVMEAMASRLPIITTDIPANGELINNGTNGWLVPVNNQVALVDAMTGLAQNEHQRSKLGAAARTRIEENFTLHKTIIATDQFFHRVLA